MFNKSKLKEVLVEYKSAFLNKVWKNEKYKWEAVQSFQVNWDVNSDEFPQMLAAALGKTKNLLASGYYFPAKMITKFAEAAPEEVRSMFIELFDESKDLYERVASFKNRASILLERYGNGAAHHFQHENAIMTYLWLRYPDRYYIYKISDIKIVASELESDYQFKQGAYAENIRNFIAFYDEICAELQQDEELRKLLNSHITSACYPDPELRTLTIDVGFYIARYMDREEETSKTDEWWPTEYTPALSVEDWITLLGDIEVFKESSLAIMKRMKDYGGSATCTQLAHKYGEKKNFYNSGSVALAKRVSAVTGCPTMANEKGDSRFWPILYLGKNAEKNEEGSYVWKLRDELSEALDNVDLTNVPLYAQVPKEEDSQHYWFLNANPKMWSMSSMPVGEIIDYTLFNDNGNKRRIFKNFIDAKVGDMVIGYESTPVKQIVAVFRVSAEQNGQRISFKKVALHQNV